MGQQITQILQQAFQGIDVDLDKEPTGRLNGTVVWEGFDGKDMGDRQNLVRNVLKEALGAEVQQVGVLLTYTPREMSSMKAA